MAQFPILKQKKFVRTALLLVSLLGFILRILHAPDILLILLSVPVVGFAVLTARQFRPRPGFLENHRPTLALLVQLGSTVLLMIASVIHLFLKQASAPILIGLTGIGGAVCIAVFTCSAVIRQRPSILLYLGLIASLICRLIPEFRVWSISPDFSAYAPDLFSLLTVMLACLHLGEFALDNGRRRTTMFFCILGVFFTGISLADGGIYGVLSGLSYILFLLAALWELMTLPRRRKIRA